MIELPSHVSRIDPRDLKGGRTVADRNGYYDSQNIVAVGGRDGVPLTFSVILHHSENREGGPGLRLLSTRSTDRGVTWSPPQPVDSPERQSHDGYQFVQRRADGTERILLLYGWNVGSQYPHDADPELTPLKRTDMQLDEGYWLRVSDDHGATWGSERHLVPVRRTEIDRDNPWGGSTMGMFLCDKPSVIDGAVYAAFQKTREGAGETPGSEAFFLRSRDLLHVDDPSDATWETLPMGEVGLQSPGGDLRLGEEPHVVQVGDVPGRLFALWRAETGRLAASYSSDGGEHWDPPFWLTYEGVSIGSGGVQEMRNPRGSITPVRLRGHRADGEAEYALLFYNNGRTERLGYTGRRVYWLTVGRSDGEVIRWNQPELALYWDGTGFDDRPDWNPDWAIVDGPGYPDFAELDDGSLVFVESNKLAVRYHEVEPRLLAHLRRQPELCHLSSEGRELDLVAPSHVSRCAAPVLPDLRAGAGFTLVVHLSGELSEVLARPTVAEAFSNVTAALGEEPTDRRITKGWSIAVTESGDLELFVTDGFGTSFRHATSAGGDRLWDGADHVVAFVVDGGPEVVSVIVDERLDDGGERAPQGWAFVPRDLGEVGGSELILAPEFGGELRRLVLFDRAILTSEAIAASRALRGVSVDGV